MSTLAEIRAVTELLRPLRSPCIVNLGAHIAEEYNWHRQACSEQAHYVMVEPDPRNVQHILDQIHIDRTTRLIVGAVSDQNGWTDFHFSTNLRNGDHASGSVRVPTGHLEMDWIKFTNGGAVRTFTLDEIFNREWLSKIDLLWTDIQGAEDLMIRGGQEALRHTRYLFMEVETVELYAGQALEKDLYAMLPGWEVMQRFEQNALLFNPSFMERGPR